METNLAADDITVVSMNIIRNNISQMWNVKHSFFVVVILVQLIAAFSTLYVTGAIANDYLSLKEDAYTNLNLYISFDQATEEDPVVYSEIEDMLFDICNNYIPGVTDGICVSTPYLEEYGLIQTVFNIEDSRYTLCYITTENIGGLLKEGRIYTEAELNSDKYCAIVAAYGKEELIINGQSFEILGKEISIAGFTQISTTPYAFRSLDLKLSYVDIGLTRILTEGELTKIENLLNDRLSGRYALQLKTTTSEDQNAILKSSLVTSSLIGISVLVVLSIVYGYVISLRKKNLAIWRLTGCSKIRAALYFFVEMGILSAPSVLLGFVSFYVVQKLWLNAIYPYMAVILTAKLYAGMYIGIMFVLFVLFAGIAFVNSRYSVKQQLIRAEI